MAVSEGGFIPGEAVHVAVVVCTETADSHGRLTAQLRPPKGRGGPGPLIVFGVTSGTTTVHDLP